MKSKTSFFSGGLFISNLRRFWPVAILFFIAEMSQFPMRLYRDWYSARNYYANDPQELKYYLAQHLSWGWNFTIIFVAAIVAMILIFGYLYSGRTAYMMAAFPVSRKSSYITGIVSAFLLLGVPIVLETVCCLLICLGIGTGLLQYLWFYLWVKLAALVLFLGISALAVFLAGNRLGAVGAYAVLNFVADAVVALFYSVMKVCYLGYASDSELSAYDIILSPLTYINDKVSVHLKYDYEGVIIQHQATGGFVMLGFLAAGLVLMILGWIAYKRRSMETAGDLISFGWVKLLLQIAVCAIGSLFVGTIVADGFWENHAITMKTGFLIMFAITVLLGALGFYAFEMISQRTFRVFTKKIAVICISYSAVMAVALIVIKADPTGFVTAVPDEGQVAWAGVSSSYAFVYGTDGEKMQEVMDYHRMLIDNRSIIANATDTDNAEMDFIQIKYVLKDGSKIWRNYTILNKEETAGIIEKTGEFYNDPEKILDGLIARNWQKFEGFSADYLQTVPTADSDMDYTTEYVPVDKESTDRLYDAVVADIKAGNYNAYGLTGYERYANCIDFVLASSEEPQSLNDSFYDYDDDEDYAVYGDIDEKSTLYFSINICENMTDTIQTLIDTGFIESADDLKYEWQLYGNSGDPLDEERDESMMY